MKLVKEHINEKFTEEGDPINDMGIGTKFLIKKWIDKINKDYPFPLKRISKYRINKDGTISVYKKTNIDVSFGNFPDYIKFKYASSNFYVGNSTLTTLRGCPEEVVETFNCCNLDLKSLEYSPKKAKDFVCWHDTDFRRSHKNIVFFTYEMVLKVCDVENEIIDDIGRYNVKLKKYIANWNMNKNGL